MAESGLNPAMNAEPATDGVAVRVRRDDALPEPPTLRLDALVEANRALGRSLDSERHEKARLLSAVSRLQGENAALRETLGPARAMSEEIGFLTEALKAQGAKLEALAGQMDRLSHIPAPAGTGQLDGANAAAEQLHAILTSRSWRAMRPLRGFGRLVRRLRG